MVRKSELRCSIVVGVGSTSACNGRTSRGRVTSQLLGRHKASWCSHRVRLTVTRNSLYRRCSRGRSIRLDFRVHSFRASQIISPVILLHVGALPLLSPRPGFSALFFLCHCQSF